MHSLLGENTKYFEGVLSIMATIPDHHIKKLVESNELVIDPYEETNVEPASVDLRLDRSFIETIETGQVIDTRDPSANNTRAFEAKSVTLEPGEEILGSTKEWVEIPPYLEAEVTGRSSLGRLFMEVHKTAGFCDPGFEGNITLEIQNHNKNAVTIYEGQRICQIIFRRLENSAEKPYGHDGSQYQGQSGATESGMQFD
jgi:dCTP deaminase